MNTFEKEFQAYNLKLNIDRGTLITAHISDLHFPAMDPQRQYNILEDQFLKKIEAMPRLDLICVNGDLYDHKDANGFINLFGLSLTVRAMKELENKNKKDR